MQLKLKDAFSAFLMSLILSVWLCAAAFCQAPGFADAVTAFNNGSYPQAAELFTQVLSANPNDAMAHYYLGVSRHCMGQIPQAAAEYGWVNANSQDPELIKRAQMGLSVVSRLLPPSAGASDTSFGAPRSTVPLTTVPPASMSAYQPTAGATGWLSPTGAQRAAAAAGKLPGYPGAPAQGSPGQSRIIDVYTSWCGWCKVFEPIFLQAQAKYGNQIYFQRINAEVGDNRSIVKKYHIQGYPTVLLLDGSGKLVKRIDGAPHTLADFEQTIFAAFPVLKPF